MQVCLQGWDSQTLNGLVVPAKVLKTTPGVVKPLTVI